MLNVQKALFCRDVPRLGLNVSGFQGKLFEFQKRDVGYLFFINKALQANQTGLGKTVEMIAMNCLQKHYRRLDSHIQVVPAQSLLQWAYEYKRFAPHLIVRVAWGRPVDRIAVYNSPFDVLLTSYNTLWKDWEYVASLHYNSISYDESSFFKNDDTKTHQIVTSLSKNVEWCIPMTATPIQNCVTDLWSIYQVLNMSGLLGNKVYYLNRYTVQETQSVYVAGKKRRHERIVAYKNLDELKQRIAPFYLRRRVSDPDVDKELPALSHDIKWLELLPQQRSLYDDAKTELLRSGCRGRDLRSRFHSLKKIVDGTQTYDSHAVDISIKSDTVMELLTNDLHEDKVVIFSWYKSNLYSLSNRLKQQRIQHDFIWGDEKDKVIRYQTQQRFHQDPTLRVILGTTALEMSLNLQAARYLIFYDLLYNPARNLQVIGRIRRIGSEFGSCVVISLVCRDTLEEKMLEVLSRRAAVSDYVFDESVSGEVFERLTDAELLELIR